MCQSERRKQGGEISLEKKKTKKLESKTQPKGEMKGSYRKQSAGEIQKGRQQSLVSDCSSPSHTQPLAVPKPIDSAICTENMLPGSGEEAEGGPKDSHVPAQNPEGKLDETKAFYNNLSSTKKPKSVCTSCVLLLDVYVPSPLKKLLKITSLQWESC